MAGDDSWHAAALPHLDQLPTRDQRKVRAGRVVTRAVRAGGIDGSVAFISTSHSREALWAQITDYPSYPGWFAGISAIGTITEIDGETVETELSVASPLGTSTYVTRRVTIAPFCMRWSRVSGDFREVFGGWDLNSVDAQTDIRYYGLVDPGYRVPALLKKTIAGNTMQRVLEALITEADRRARH